MSQSDLSSNPEVQALTAQTDQFVALAQTYSVTTAVQFTAAGEQLKEIKAAAKRLDTLRKTMTQPLDAAKKAIMDFFRAPEEKLARAESGIKRAMLAYTAELDRKRREDQARADAEARKQQEKLQQQAARAQASGKVEKAAELEERAATVVAPVINREPPKVSGLSFRDAWCFEIVDEKAIPREFLMVDEAKIRRFVANMKGDTQIAGVRVYSEKRMAAGA